MQAKRRSIDGVQKHGRGETAVSEKMRWRARARAPSINFLVILRVWGNVGDVMVIAVVMVMVMGYVMVI